MIQEISTPEDAVERVTALAEFVWDDPHLAGRWMRTAHWGLNGQSPMEAARTEAGAVRVEDALNRLFYGMPV